MRTTLLLLLLTLPFLGHSQFFGVSASYVYDGHLGTDWRHSRGLQLGAGMENMKLQGTPFTLSARYYGAFTMSKFDSRVEDIEFLLNDTTTRMGFAKVEYKKLALGMEFDLGFQQWEESVVEPYISVGAKFQNYATTLKYDLYEPESCDCYDNSSSTLTETKTMGFTSGLGIKIRPTNNFYIDLRATYYGGWGLANKGANPLMPDTDSFHINDFGEPTFNYSPGRYADGITFNVGVIFRIGGQDGTGLFSFINEYSGSSSRSSSYDSSGSSCDSSSESSSSSSQSNSDCTPVKLTPKPKREPK